MMNDYDFGMYTFNLQYKDGHSVTITHSGETGLDELLEAFECFLKASSFNLDGMTLEMVPQDYGDCCGHNATSDGHSVDTEELHLSIDDVTPEEWNQINRKYTMDYPSYPPYEVKFTDHD
jgi:hypothetical protein